MSVVVVRSLAALKRLEKDADAPTGIDLRSCDGVFAARIARWKEPLSRVPLTVRTAPQLGDDGLAALLALPQLVALELEPYVLRHPSARRLASATGLRSLDLSLRLVAPETADAVLDQVAQMTWLRRLTLRGHERPGHGERPSDDDVRQIRAALPQLEALTLTDCSAVTV